MKILFITRLYWPHQGGVEKHVENLSRELIKLGHEITIITEQFSCELKEEELKNGIRIKRVPYFALRSKLSLWIWMEQNINLIDEADVIHIHDVFWWYLPIWILRLFKPVYITFHGYEGVDPPTKKAVLWRKLAEIACRKSICIGEFMRKWYKTRPDLISYGAANLKPQPTTKALTAAFMGRFSYDTGVDVYVAAAKSIKQLTQVNFFGSGDLAGKLKAESSACQRIGFYDWTTEIPRVFRDHRFAFVSRYLSILEAMQAKRLVVAVYNNQIKKDYLTCHPMRDNMIIAKDSLELRIKLEEIISHPEEEKIMVDRAYNWAKEQTWQKLVGEYLNLWSR